MVVIEVEHLRKTYDSVVAVDDISFRVFRGEIFGMVGPNGAGKTTTIECVEGLHRPDSGIIKVLELDPIADHDSLLKRIGIQLQESDLPDRIKVKEIMELFASLYENSFPWKQLLKNLGLSAKENAYYGNLSGGEKKRVFVALALIPNPEIVFLDELTTGLDPHGRQAVWSLIEDVQKEGRTIFMTTHYMDEAERLCDRIAIINKGRIIALDTPEALIQKLEAKRKVVFTAVEGSLELEAIKLLSSVVSVEQSGEKIIVYGKGEEVMGEVAETAKKFGWKIKNIQMRHVTLEDAFIFLTGGEKYE